MRLLGIGVCCFAILESVAGQASAQQDSRPQFEVASIKPSSPDARGMFISPGPGGGVRITNMTLKEMIVLGWRVQPFQVSGGPSWLDSVHYDVVAKPEAKPKQDELAVMLQALLADRFQLVIRRETKELPLFALVLARKDGKLGSKLVPHEGDCTPPDPSKPPPPPEPGKPPALFCGGMMMGPRGMNAIGVPIANLLPMLSRILATKVVDKTGLTGNFDVSAEWAQDESVSLGLPQGLPPAPPSDTTGPSIFTALQEQLGLKLESQKGPVEILVVDRAEKPSEN
jgi:uncharacterized protein (TIGR03435 family)